MKNKFIFFLLIVINVAEIFIIIKFNNERKEFTKCNEAITKLQDNLNYIKQKENLISNCYKIELSLENSSIKNKDQLFISKDFDTTSYQAILKTLSNPLFFYFSNIDCHSCVQETFSYLDSLQRNGFNNIVVISYFENFHEYYDFVILQNIDIPILWTNNKIIKDSKYYINNFPLLFRLDRSLRIHNAFIPKSDLPKRMKIYFTRLNFNSF